MKYLKKEGEIITYPYELTNLKLDYPNTSFPENPKEKTLNEYGIYLVEETSMGNKSDKKYVSGVPVLVNGKYIETWIEVALNLEELNTKKESQLESLRQRRDSKLRECDWVMLTDSPYKTNLKHWEDYRQALRDITSQLDVFNIVWPIKPI